MKLSAPPLARKIGARLVVIQGTDEVRKAGNRQLLKTASGNGGNLIRVRRSAAPCEPKAPRFPVRLQFRAVGNLQGFQWLGTSWV